MLTPFFFSFSMADLYLGSFSSFHPILRSCVAFLPRDFRIVLQPGDGDVDLLQTRFMASPFCWLDAFFFPDRTLPECQSGCASQDSWLRAVVRFLSRLRKSLLFFPFSDCFFFVFFSRTHGSSLLSPRAGILLFGPGSTFHSSHYGAPILPQLRVFFLPGEFVLVRPPSDCDSRFPSARREPSVVK